jgi:hypothetical protein
LDFAGLDPAAKARHHSKIMRNKPDDIWGPLVRQGMGDGDGGGGRS